MPLSGSRSRHGLAGRQLLVVACGTGKSFVSLLERGFEVTACDISPEMVAEARYRAEGRAELHVADMRRLPVLGEFNVNALAAYREIPDVVVEDDERFICWRGGLAELAAPGEEAEVVIDVFTHEGDGLWRRSLSRQRHRHHAVEEIRELAEGGRARGRGGRRTAPGGGARRRTQRASAPQGRIRHATRREQAMIWRP